SVFEQRVAPVLRDEKWKRVGLVNNAAAIGPLTPLERLTPDDLMDVYAVNSAAPIWLMGFVVRYAPRDAAIRIVNVSSGAAKRGAAGLSAYGSSKAALRLAGIALASEADRPPAGATPRNLAILSYEPSVVETAMQAHARSLSPEVFPWVGDFQRFKNDGMLIPAGDVTAVIAGFLESDPSERFGE